VIFVRGEVFLLFCEICANHRLHAAKESFISVPLNDRHRASIAQSVEQGIENPCVAGSIPARGTISYVKQ
jgi:hypothetical protein